MLLWHEKLFTHEGYDMIDALEEQYNHCTFLRALGPFSEGNEVASITVNYTTGVLRVWLSPEDTEPAWATTITIEVA